MSIQPEPDTVSHPLERAAPELDPWCRSDSATVITSHAIARRLPPSICHRAPPVAGFSHKKRPASGQLNHPAPGFITRNMFGIISIPALPRPIRIALETSTSVDVDV